MYGLLIALALAAGCATGTETGKDDESMAWDDVAACPSDGNAEIPIGGGFPLVAICDTSDGSCDGPADWMSYAGKLMVRCPSGLTYEARVRWLD